MSLHARIRDFRKARGLSLARLGLLCNLSKSYLSKIESGKQSPPISTLQTIATALGVDASELIEVEATDGEGTPNLDIVRTRGKARDTDREIDSQAGYSYQSLLHRFRNKYMSPFLMRVPKGRTKSFTHDAEEFTFVVKGAVHFHYDGKRHLLRSGDSAYFDARIRHWFENDGPHEAVLLTVHYAYRRF